MEDLNLHFKKKWDQEYKDSKDLSDQLSPSVEWHLCDAINGINIYLDKKYADPNRNGLPNLI